jgi:antitoxin (DNA-binding transcriptional repressor) of toxin-antitoxin stability system
MEPRRITQRELRNNSGAIMRGLDNGETYIVTRNGVPVGELRPIRREQFVPVDVARAVFAAAPSIDATRFRSDVDGLVDQDATPRA